VHALHEGAAIHAVHLSAGFAVTGAEDRLLRVWPLDFSAHFLETEHEGSVTAIDASPDGLKLLIGTASGTIGMLDVPTLKHATIVRSHTDIIYGLALDPHNREFVTASCDGSIRVWELDGTQAQLVEFELPEGCSRCVAYHPTEYVIAAGFDDGSVRVFDIASTSLLEEYTQHAGKVMDLAYSADGERLYSAGTDCGLTAYDVVHSYQPSRAFSAKAFPDAKPCLALTSDDKLLVAGGLQNKAVLTLDASTLTVLNTFSLSANATAVAMGPGRTLFLATLEGTLLCVPLTAGGLAASEAAVLPHAHTAPIDALALARSGAHVATGGHDKKLRMWPMATVREGGAGPEKTRGCGPGACQPFIGAPDVITKLAFSSDGQTLLMVGGGDTVFVWEYRGPAGADPEDVVDESVRQAEAERDGRLLELEGLYERAKERLPSPSQVLAGAASGADGDEDEEGDEDEDEDEDEDAGAAGAAAPKTALADVGPTADDFEALRQRLRALGTAEAGYLMAGAEAGRSVTLSDPVVAAAVATKQQQQEEDPQEEDEEEEEEDEDEDEGEDESPFPRKRYRLRVVYTDDAPVEAVTDAALAEAMGARELDAISAHPGGRSAQSAAEAVTWGSSVAASVAEARGLAAEHEGDSLATHVASGLELLRLIGFSTHAHDHVVWQPSTATLLYASGDTLVVDSLAPGTAPVHLTGGSGEISTLALSNDGRFAAVGAGSDAPLCVYDLHPRAADLDLAASSEKASAVLRMRLPGHEGGVQCLAFLGQAALASLGLHDGQLRVHSVISGALLLSASTPPDLHCLAVSADGLQISAAGKGGLYTWRVATQPAASLPAAGGDEDEDEDEPSEEPRARPMLLPLSPRLLPADVEGNPVHATAMLHLSPTLSLTGDTEGTLCLWGPPPAAASTSAAFASAAASAPIGVFTLSSLFDEIDLLHASVAVAPVGASDFASWHLVVGGASATHAVCRFRLTIPPPGGGGGGGGGGGVGGRPELVLTPLGEIELDGDAIAMSWAEDGTQGVVGTAAGSLWHVQWTTGAATLLTGAVPPPLVALAVPRAQDGAAPTVLASLSLGEMQGESCGVLLWDARPGAPCGAPLARIHQPNEPATALGITPTTGWGGKSAKGVDDPTAGGLVAVGYSSGRVQLVSIGSLQLLTQRRVHVAPIACLAFGPRACLLSAAADGEVRLHSAALGELLAPLATLRPPTNVPVTCLDLSYGGYIIGDTATPTGGAPVALWAVASEHQQVEVWPLVRDARSAAEATPLVSLSLESAPVLKLPAKLAPLGWRCLVSFLPGRPGVIACTGLTRERRLTLYDFLQRVPVAALSLDEWPTSLAACDCAPLLAVGGASGAVQLIEYLASPTTAEEAAAEERVLDSGGSVLIGAASVELHCHNVRSLHFGGNRLFSAAEDEVAVWQMPI